MKILFTGDVFFNPSKDDKKLIIDDGIKTLFSSCDNICVDLESPVAGKNEKKLEGKISPCLKQDKERLITLFRSFGEGKPDRIICDLANNHIMDYGEDGLKETKAMLDENRIAYTGAGRGREAYAPLVLEKDGVRTGIAAAAEPGFGCCSSEEETGFARYDSREYYRTIKKLKDECDFVIALVHAGLENETLPLPEIREHYRFLIDNGADMVIAHHPHIIQGKEDYKGKKIYYSLGNFIFDSSSGKGESNCRSIVLELDIKKENDIVIREIPSQYKSGMIETAASGEGIEKEFADATKSLMSDDYDELITGICCKHLERYKDYYYYAIGAERNNIKNLVIALKRCLKGNDRFDENWMYHNLVIDSHRWTLRRALEARHTKGRTFD
ncbi:MAG: CapA family protein [Lachnospiraceae bacterium]|nr:CapA family protein [Lachnospiraceae bacterium]